LPNSSILIRIIIFKILEDHFKIARQEKKKDDNLLDYRQYFYRFF
jgi:hypothetical protein